MGVEGLTKIQLILCDDNAADLENLRRSADEYIKNSGLYGETVCFSEPSQVLKFSEERSKNNAAVYLFDVIMPEVDGIELGKRLREKDRSSAIIYISSSREYSLEAFSVHAFSYLIKPYSREKLFSELDHCLDRINSGVGRFSIKTADSTVVVELSEIIAAEYLNHRLILHLANGSQVEGAYRREAFDVQAEELMQTGLFLKVSASYLINCRNVQGVKTDEFVMRDGSSYKITRKYINARQRYIDGEMSNNTISGLKTPSGRF